MKKIVTAFSVLMILAASFAFASNAYADPLPIDISSGTITLSNDNYTYDGTEKTPSVTLNVMVNEQPVTLVENTDYKVTYSDNINAGNATVSVEGIGNYSGTNSKSFTINPLNVYGHIIFANTSKAYPNIAPQYVIKYDNTVLTQGVDYNITVENYAKIGVQSAKITVTGIGNYTGVQVHNENVNPYVVDKITVSNRTTTSFQLNWPSQSNYGATGYKVYTCNEYGKKTKLYATVKTNSCKITKMSAGTDYYFIIRAYKTDGENTINGDANPVFKTATTPGKVQIQTVTKSKNKKSLIVKWKALPCSGYIIEYTKDKSFKKGIKKVYLYNSSLSSKSISIPKSDKHYYVRIKAFKYANNAPVHGAYSTVFSSSFSKLYATYTTRYVRNANRTNNLKLACKAIDGTIVHPGETFSFNGTVGKRTEAKGYKKAYVFTGPKSHELGIGGGVCQVASTMFNAALLANFQIVERHQHSQRVTYCPLGRDAAIYWGSENFRFKNTSNYPIMIRMKCADGKLTCSYYVCYDVSPKKVKLSVSRSGKHFTLKRKVGGKVNYTTHSTY